ncbi:GRAS transcription factor [Rhynchospora pubera]|uniref:GRAS transcription factor n=1 Tax=Rhynchospora pubera TaxID=906938 RepID=A0AAV8BNK2_9POAL|nr:GRAS transcription factor [Rhynchospora pubera]
MMDPTLDYISRYLLEEEIEELNINAHKDEAALQDIEKPFYEILGQKYPPTPNEQLVCSSQLESDLSSSSSSSLKSESSNNDTLVGSLPVMEFHKGIEEGMKFLPTINNLATDCKEKIISADPSEVKYENSAWYKLAEKDDFGMMSRPRIRKYSIGRDLDILEGRNSKISMVDSEEPVRDDVYDEVLLDHGDHWLKGEIWSLREALQLEASSGVRKEIQGDHELYTLLIHCSEAVAIYDQQRARELLNKIRIKSSPDGNGIQRLACVLADALEARLAGVGSEYFRRLIAKRVKFPYTYFLKGYHMFIRAVPLIRVYLCFSNRNILNVTRNARKVHVIDLGTKLGFQWPSLIQAISKREGGPPKLRITCIDLPEPGFHPAKRIENVGQRLREYARSFNVPFEYKGIASQWESIHIEELTINDDEVVIVSSLSGLSRVKDETFSMDSPRDRVLQLIRQIKPQIFIQAEPNRSYSSFFPTRFRQVLSTYAACYDLVDSTIPRKDKERKLLENVYFVPAIINSVACEGSDLKEKPETLKQWQRRNLRACFEQLPVNPDIVKECKNLVRDGYDNRYFVQEDDNWLLQGWKGRVLSGVTAWKPKLDEGC